MYTNIKTFEDACKALGIDPSIINVDGVPDKHKKAREAHYKLVIIVEAVNEGWMPNWADTSERKWELWPDVIKDETKDSGFGLADFVCDYWFSYTFVGSRLCFKDRDRAKYTFEQFKGLYEDYLLIG